MAISRWSMSPSLACWSSSIGDGDIALLTANFADPQGYGRIVRNGSGKVVDIVEQKDASAGQLALAEVNTGFIAAGRDALACCPRTGHGPERSGETVPDGHCCQIAAEQGLRIVDVQASAPVNVLGVNTKSDLAVVERHYQRQRAADFLRTGGDYSRPRPVRCPG